MDDATGGVVSITVCVAVGVAVVVVVVDVFTGEFILLRGLYKTRNQSLSNPRGRINGNF
jgi:hypothetical protein